MRVLSHWTRLSRLSTGGCASIRLDLAQPTAPHFRIARSSFWETSRLTDSNLEAHGGGGSGLVAAGFGGGGGFRRGIDEVTLKKIAEMTGGEYYSAESAHQLQDVFQSLPTYLITKHEIMEISVAFTALGALLAAAAIVLSMVWNPLP